MATLIELTTLDLRFQDYRMRDDAREARLRASIAERGIEEPLQGIDLVEEEEEGDDAAVQRTLGTESPATSKKIRHVLLNGFQRYRYAKKLGIHEVPYVALAQDEAAGIIHLLRVAKQQNDDAHLNCQGGTQLK